MDPTELLSIPHSALTRKQRKERAAIKAEMAKRMKLMPGYAIGRVRVAGQGDLPPGAYITVDHPLDASHVIAQLGKAQLPGKAPTRVWGDSILIPDARDQSA